MCFGCIHRYNAILFDYLLGRRPFLSFIFREKKERFELEESFNAKIRSKQLHHLYI